MIEIQAMFPVMVASNLVELNMFYTNYFGFQAVFFLTQISTCTSSPPIQVFS